MPIPPATIDEVIAELDIIVQKSLAEDNRLGLFAALYRKVTANVRDGIANNQFDDGPRMERLDVIFANRYLEAYHAFSSGQPLTNSWQITFEAAQRDDLLIIQHLLVGMNAHISLDLGIAAAQVAHGTQIETLERDFNAINGLLGELVEQVQSALSTASPTLWLLDFVAGQRDEDLARFNMNLFRQRAWGVANMLYELHEPDFSLWVEKLDNQVKSENELFIRTSTLLPSWLRSRMARWQNARVTEAVQALAAL